ncbi:MAG: hypothetical protein Kow0069_10810 [Promethearchaeota archaeon]
MKRIPLGVAIGFSWMMFAPFLFSEWEFGYWATTPAELVTQFSVQPSRALLTWFGLAFQGNFLETVATLVRAGPTLTTLYSSFFLSEVLFASAMAWVSTGVLAGTFAGGRKRGLGTALLVFLLFLLTWLLLNVFAGEDLALIFSYYLFPTLDNVLTAFLFSALGGLIGGTIAPAPGE